MTFDLASRRSGALVRPLFALALALASVGGVATASAQDTVVVVHHHHEHQLRPRIRFGVSGVGGGFFGPVYGAAGGIAPRIGLQLTDVVAVYLQGHLMLGGFEPDRPDPRFGGFAFHEAMFELTIADRFQFGAGPSLDFIWGCDSNDPRPSCGRSNARLGGNFRFAVVLGHEHETEGHRRGFVISIEAHPTWLDPNFNTMFLFGLGGELY